jgi:hypothetical protein
MPRTKNLESDDKSLNSKNLKSNIKKTKSVSKISQSLSQKLEKARKSFPIKDTKTVVKTEDKVKKPVLKVNRTKEIKPIISLKSKIKTKSKKKVNFLSNLIKNIFNSKKKTEVKKVVKRNKIKRVKPILKVFFFSLVVLLIGLTAFVSILYQNNNASGTSAYFSVSASNISNSFALSSSSSSSSVQSSSIASSILNDKNSPLVFTDFPNITGSFPNGWVFAENKLENTSTLTKNSSQLVFTFVSTEPVKDLALSCYDNAMLINDNIIKLYDNDFNKIEYRNVKQVSLKGSDNFNKLINSFQENITNDINSVAKIKNSSACGNPNYTASIETKATTKAKTSSSNFLVINLNNPNKTTLLEADQIVKSLNGLVF